MPRSNSRKSAYTARVDASDNLQNPAAIQTDTNIQPCDDDVEFNPSAYIGYLSNYERLDMVLKYMWNKHRWTINHFLHHMVTADPEKEYDRTIKTRVKKLSGAITQEQVVKQLMRYSDGLREIGASGLMERLRVEMDRLGSSDFGLGDFDPEMSVDKLDIPHIYSRIQETAPELCRLLLALLEPKHHSQRDWIKDSQGPITIITASIAYAYAPKKCDRFPLLLGVHLHSMGVKRRTLSVLAGLGLIPSYHTIMRKRSELAAIGKVPLPPCMYTASFMLYTSLTLSQRQIKKLAQSARQQMIISWDNFDYNETVRHQSLRDPTQHICATTGKLCVSQNMPEGGLYKSMFHPHLALDVNDVCFSPGNLDDEILHQTQRYWIAEAIRYTHRAAIHDIFTDELVEWPQFPHIERLSPQKTIHHSLGPILENEGTIDGTYQVIDKIFLEQFGYDPSGDFSDLLHLVYGDQKTVSLIQTVQKERQGSTLAYDKYDWILPIPGLFHWRTNYMDMIHDLYSGLESAPVGSTLYHNKNFMGLIQGHKSPFHHKEEVAIHAFNGRVTALYYQFLPPGIRCQYHQEVDHYIRQSGRAGFLNAVERIRESIFAFSEQCNFVSKPAKASGRQSEYGNKSKPQSRGAPVDLEFSAHAKFLQQMEVYKSLKLAIKLADIGMIRRVIARCCILFNGSSKSKYAFLSLYMTWLTGTPAADEELQRAILANGLVNLRGAEDSWFEMDRLNEFFNLQMKTLMSTRRTSSIDTATLFRNTALTASYCTDLKESIERAFGEHTKSAHTAKDVSDDVRNLAFQIYNSGSVNKHKKGRDSLFQPPDIVSRGCQVLVNGVMRFNKQVVQRRWTDDDVDDDLDQTSMPIRVLDHYITQEPEDDEVEYDNVDDFL